MKQMTKQPNSRYYRTKASGGYNGAVKGHPTVKGADVLCNCVGFANGRFNQAINDPNLEGSKDPSKIKPFKYQLTCNAENFIEAAKKQGLKISKEPTLGGIMVWQKGKTLGGGDGAGHVAFVECIYTDGTIITSESGWNAYAFKRVSRSNKNGRWGQAEGYKFRGCIINPYIKNVKTVKQTKAQKIVAKAKSFAWKYGTPAKTYAYKTGSARGTYKIALKKYMGKKAKVSQTDCGYFVSTCVRAAGVSSTFKALPASAKNAYPAVPNTMKIVSKGKVGTLKAGDIIRYRKTNGHQHVVLYIGNGYIAHASRNHAFPRIAKAKPWNNKNVKKSSIQVLRAK